MTRLFVGGLNNSTPVEQKELEKLFRQYGTLADSWVAKSPAGFAFVTYIDKSEARLALADLNGVYFQGKKLFVEPAKGKQQKQAEAQERAERGERRQRYPRNDGADGDRKRERSYSPNRRSHSHRRDSRSRSRDRRRR